jgi:hypothetical protein
MRLEIEHRIISPSLEVMNLSLEVVAPLITTTVDQP